MTEFESRTLEELVDDVLADASRMPVRRMEAVLARGEEAVGPVLSGLRSALDAGDPMKPLWPVVLLGELGSREAAPALAEVLLAAEPDDLVLPQAAAEALAKIGPSALPTLRSLLDGAEPLPRVWAYGAVGWIRDDEAYALLADALSVEREMIDVVAMALGDQGREEAVPLLEEALDDAEPWQRVEVEESIRRLHRDEAEPLQLERDWRLRHRPEPGLGVPQLTWPAVTALTREAGAPSQREPLPVRPVEEILADPDDREGPERCESCGEPLVPETGVPVCPETALRVALLQRERLAERGEEVGSEDLFDVLDAVEEELWELGDRGEPRSRRARERREDRRTGLTLLRGGCTWLVERGVESVSAGRATLLAAASRLAGRYGDPDGDLSAPGRPAASSDVGRNDPCPCGSGEKYKKCCGDPARRTGAGPGVGRPHLETFDGETVSIARAHYRVTDPDAAREALGRSPELEPEPGGDAFVWAGERDGEVRRVLGQAEIEGDRLELWCLSEERLARGKTLLEEAAGRWLVHRADTSQDPWRAAQEMSARAAESDRDRSSGDELPPGVESGVVRRVLDRHYREWPDEPVPALGGRTPREAAEEGAGRERVAALIRSFEEMEETKPPGQRYDFGWLWKELGLDDLRGP